MLHLVFPLALKHDVLFGFYLFIYFFFFILLFLLAYIFSYIHIVLQRDFCVCVFVSHMFKIKFTVKIHTSSASSSSCVSIFNPCPAEPGYTVFANSVDPDQLASEEAN